MKTRRNIQLLFMLLALVMSGAFLFYSLINNYVLPSLANNDLRVHYFDIGQGDASLIQTPGGKNILIDGGPGENIMLPLSQALSWHDNTIDLMILTHPHDDHVAGLIPVLKKYQVRQILYTGVIHNSPSYLEFLKTIKNKNISLKIIDRAQKINLDEDCFLEIVYPRENLAGQTVLNLNDSSIVARLVYGNNSFLFMGDAEVEVEEELIELNIDLSADIIQVGHHGSNTSSSWKFIDYVKPKIAIISAGKDNKFGHPSLRVIRRYERFGTKIYRTDIDSAISFRADGKEIILLDK